MTTCTDCLAADGNPLWGGFHGPCDACTSRALAHGPIYFAAAQADALIPAYRSALQVAFGKDWQAGHERVKAWAQRISTAKGTV